jgi:hypothetical protein
MTDTTTLLSTALENEAKLLLKMIGELENEELFEFTRVLAAAQPSLCVSSSRSLVEILFVARNVTNIENALENIFTV